MKKIITIIALIAFTATATAQVKFGARLGGGLGSVSKNIHADRYEGQGTGEQGYFSTYYGGFTMEVPASEKWLLDIELNYIFLGVVGEGSTILHNVNVPLAIKYDISGFRPKVGGYVSYIPAVTSHSGNDYYSLTKKDIEKFDYGALFGLEYNFNEKYFIETNFYLGLANLLTKDPRHSSDYLRTRSILVGVGYRFN